MMLRQRLSRRETLVSAGALVALAPHVAAAARSSGDPFSWEWLQARALAAAQRPYVAPPPPPHGVSAVDYDALNHIAYRPERTLWGKDGTPGVRMFPLNRYARTPVQISIVENGRARALTFSRSLFSGAEHLPADVAGFSGFRLMNVNEPGDWLAFQGASYFRSAGSLNQYGLSARGLAIDTGLPTPEEFPDFTHFWLEPGANGALTVYALLASPRVSGAWRFVNRKTPTGVVQDVSLVMQLRGDVARLGIAPLTSMFWYGEGDRAQAIDWRPEIHDSDGLAMMTGGGERIWRPLENPPHAILNSFADENPKGFGLFQRDRNFDHYQDDGVFYEKRPNLWVEPRSPWGAGAVSLFEMPTTRETDDNIVAFWTPAGPARAGRRYAMDYRLRWSADEPQPAPARVVDCWRGTAGRPGTEPIAGATRLVADFTGDSLAGLDRSSGVTSVVDLDQGKPLSVAVYPVVGVERTWRLIVDVAHNKGQTINMRAYLRNGRAALTETLIYQFV